MKKQCPKRMLVLTSLLVMSVGVWFFMYSNASDTNLLTIPTDKYTAVQNIQQVHLNPEVLPDKGISHADKVGIMNDGGAVLGIGSVEERDGSARVFSLKNKISAQESVIAGQGNENTSKNTSSLII